MMMTRPTLPLALPALLVVGALSIGMLAAAGPPVATGAPVALPPVLITPGTQAEPDEADPCAQPFGRLPDGTPVQPAGADPFGATLEDQRFIGRGDPVRRERGFRYS